MQMFGHALDSKPDFQIRIDQKSRNRMESQIHAVAFLFRPIREGGTRHERSLQAPVQEPLTNSAKPCTEKNN